MEFDKNRIVEMREDGVSKHESFLDEGRTSVFCEDIEKFIQSYDVFNVPPDPNATYESLRNSKEVKINRRIATRDGDEGLIDVWNVDKVLSDTSMESMEIIKEHVMKLMEESYGVKYKFFTHNLYINRGVRTRGIHADSHFFPSRVKSFLFLTDVPDESYGPFSFIKGSHTGPGLKYHRQYSIYEPLNEDDYSKYEIFTGIKKGDLVTAAVAGAHRGLPQQEGKTRIALVSSFDPVR